MKTFGFNQCLQLWRNFHASRPDAVLTISDGHVIAPADGCLARFDDDAHAAKVLTEAGCKFTIQSAQPSLAQSGNVSKGRRS